MTRWRAIVFDLDDTLYPERDFVIGGFRAVAEWAEDQLGVSADQALTELEELFQNGVRGRTFDRWLSAHGVTASDLIPQMVRVYRQHQPHLTPYPDVPPVLKALRAKHRLGLLSDGFAEVQRRKLDALGLTNYFDAVIISDEVGPGARKPSTRVYEAILNALGAGGPEAVYVGDNPTKDFLGARALGMSTVRIRRPDGLYTQLEAPSREHEPDFTLPSIAELVLLAESVAGSWPG